MLEKETLCSGQRFKQLSEQQAMYERSNPARIVVIHKGISHFTKKLPQTFDPLSPNQFLVMHAWETQQMIES